MSKKNNKRSPQPQPTPQTGTETVVSERPAHIDNGEAARGNVNARENQTRTQPEPSPAMAALGNNEATEKVIALRPNKGTRANIFEQRHVEISAEAANKLQLLSEASQRLAEAADLADEGVAKSREARVAADKASIALYTLRVGGQVSADEVSNLLGDKYGYRVKGGTDKYVAGSSGGVEPSKTPYGDGEAIRKRIVRAVQAHEFVNGGDGGRFFSFADDAVAGEGSFEGMTVGDVLKGMETGEIGFWAAYEGFAAVKRNAAVKVNPAFDPKRIAAIAEALQEEGAAKQFVGNNALRDAYTALRDMINVIGEEAASLMAEAA